ncbi:hypothetical protein [Mycoplasmopsis canis]|uniref:hypothetical protein n=1 Tax=Mycoplasmopsis canis TaxID=29555 RepID=UPI001CB79CD7|nr:hypothetical protein [Mycoplasmopsis canis]
MNPTNNKENIFKDIRKRVFVVGGGTSTMLSKLNLATIMIIDITLLQIDMLLYFRNTLEW